MALAEDASLRDSAVQDEQNGSLIRGPLALSIYARHVDCKSTYMLQKGL